MRLHKGQHTFIRVSEATRELEEGPERANTRVPARKLKNKAAQCLGLE